ncbi:N-acetylmuramoyl-L-alanine amidase family protein [Lawsonibacter sp. LCP25S3_G6]|uniref:N-acetylmuramoyl-L-alanine amidase family protein n=1 Tax=unclassified Lawsonibacter TaxID=2617946 RepID=UPI003F956FBB
MLICIDAGHYLGTPGKRCLKTIDPGETREWVLNNRVAHKVQQRLTAYDCTTMRVDDLTGQREITLFDRVLIANQAGADVYLSIHHNAGINGGSGGGIVVYVCPGVGEDTTSLQRAVYEHTVASTGLRGNRSNPLGVADFYVLKYTTMPAVLGEFGFMDSTTDTPIILTEKYADQLADGIVAALVEQYHLKEVDSVTYEEWVAYYERHQKEQAAKEPTEEWQKDTVKKAIAAGISDGSRPLDKMTRVEGMAMVLAGMEK